MNKQETDGHNVKRDKRSSLNGMCPYGRYKTEPTDWKFIIRSFV
jgi:hypothetical protein